MRFSLEILSLIVILFFPSFLIAWLGCFVIRKNAVRWGLLDHPGVRKIHRIAKPTSAGLAIATAVFVPLAVGLIFACYVAALQRSSPSAMLLTYLPEIVTRHAAGVISQSSKLFELLFGAVILLFLGLLDDIRGLDWRLRIGVETVVSVALVSFGWRFALPVFFQTVPEPIFSIVQYSISIVWIVGFINSFNMLDNMDGLSGGVAAIASTMLALVLLSGVGNDGNIGDEPQYFVAGMFLLLSGAQCGFLRHNRFPAKIFMGDTGAYFTGYLIAMLTISATFAGDHLPSHTIFAPLCVLAVPIYDTTTVILIRLRQGKSPFKGDKNHYSHRLVRLGMSPIHAVRTVYLTTFCCSLGALLLYEISSFGALVVLCMIITLLLLVANIEFAASHGKTDLD